MPDSPTDEMRTIAKKVVDRFEPMIDSREWGMSRYRLELIVLEELMRPYDMVRDRRGGWRQLGVYDG
jgi:hypothetical protein